MPEFDVEKEEINLFKIVDTYVFSHYFKGDKVFSDLGDYYNGKNIGLNLVKMIWSRLKIF